MLKKMDDIKKKDEIIRELQKRIKDLEKMTSRYELMEEELKKSDERFRMVGEVAYDLIYEWCTKNDSLEWFGDIDRLLGYKKGEISRDIKDWLELIHPDDKSKLKNAVKCHRSSKKPILYEYRVRHKDGKYRYWRDHGLPVLDETGQPHRWVGVCTDITERKLAEQKLLESEEKYRVLVENVDQMIVVAQDEQIKFVSKKVIDMLGYQPEELGGKHFVDFIHPEDRKIIVERYQKRLKGEDLPKTYPFRVVSKAGEIRWVEIMVSPVQWDGKPATLSFLTDITLQRRAEKSLQFERNRAQMYIDIAGVMLVSLNREGSLSLINRKGSEILGYKQEEIIGKNWFDNFIPSSMREQVREVFLQLMAGEVELGEYYENPVVSRCGEEKVIAWHNTLYRDEEGNVAGTLSSGEDITIRKKAEKELEDHHQHLEEQVKVRTKELEEMNTELKKKNAELERFHDATVEREHRMWELRKQIEKLEQEKMDKE